MYLGSEKGTLIYISEGINHISRDAFFLSFTYKYFGPLLTSQDVYIYSSRLLPGLFTSPMILSDRFIHQPVCLSVCLSLYTHSSRAQYILRNTQGRCGG